MGLGKVEANMQETAQQYIQRILGHVEGQDPIKVQKSTAAKLHKLSKGLTPKQLRWQPEPGKWSIAEILAHLADVEIVASWRMRSIIGSDGITIQPFDQDAWASVFQYSKRDPKQSLEIFRVLRENNLMMLKSLPPEAWEKHGMHLERGKETIAHLARMFAGHDTNHVSQIERIVANVKKASPKKTKSKKAKRRKK
jgi:DinB superfamily